MKTLQEIKNEVAIDKGYRDWESFYSTFNELANYTIQYMDEVAKRYVEQAIEVCKTPPFIFDLCDLKNHMTLIDNRTGDSYELTFRKLTNE